MEESSREETPIEAEVEADDEDLFEDFEDPGPAMLEKPEGGSQKVSGSEEDSVEPQLGSEEDLFGDFEDFSQSSTPERKPRRASFKKQPPPKPSAPSPLEKSKLRPNQISSQVNGLLESIFADFSIAANDGPAFDTPKPDHASQWASVFSSSEKFQSTQDPTNSDSEEEMDIGKKIFANKF